MTPPKNVPIVIIANSLEEIGGVQRVVHVLAEGLAQRGYDVTLLGVNPHPDKHCYVDNPSYASDFLYEPLGKEAYKREHKAARLRGVKKLSKILAGKPPGIIITAQRYSLRMVNEADHKGWSVISQYHSSAEAAVRTGDLGMLTSLAADSDYHLLLTQPDADKFQQAGLNNTRVMSNPISFLPRVPASLTAKTVVSIGRYSEEKSLDYLIRAWALVEPNFPEWKLRLMGTGPLKDELKALAESLDLKNVDILGPTQNAEAELLNSSIFALSSQHEGLPMVLLESMACGLPIVTFDCAPGISDLIDSGVDGVIVEKNNVEELAAELGLLMESKDRRVAIGTKAKEKSAKFSPETVLDNWEQLFVDTLR